MRTNRNTIPSVEFRIDPLGLDRLRWLKSLFSSRGEIPSNSVIIRRALTVYLQHVEKQLTDESKLLMEIVRLKAHTKGDRSPWKQAPTYDGHSFSKMVHEANRQQGIKAMRQFGIDLGVNQ
jgi:hypothetical protein